MVSLFLDVLVGYSDLNSDPDDLTGRCRPHTDAFLLPTTLSTPHLLLLHNQRKWWILENRAMSHTSLP